MKNITATPAKLQPFFPCSLLNSGFADAAELLLHCITVNISRNLSVIFGYPVVKKVGLPDSFQWPERESVPRKWPVFTAKSTRNTITLFLFSILRCSI